jgi:hypothetical protein
MEAARQMVSSRRNVLSNIALIAVTASYLIQIGAGAFALGVVGRVLVAAPPRSLAMLEGAYAYDGNAFWEVVPPITALLFVLAIITNWKTRRRGLVIAAFLVFIISGAVTVGLIGPIFSEFAAAGYSDVVNPELQRRAAIWYAADWGARLFDFVGAIALLVALTRSPSNRADI